MSASPEALLAIVLMAVITAFTRVGGAWLMRLVPITPAVEGFLASLSSSVIVAIVATVLARDGLREVAAVAAAVALMWVLRSPALAMGAGVLTAALWYGWLG
ncbi:MAG: AzlD family protein [Pseudomonadota bacterium]